MIYITGAIFAIFFEFLLISKKGKSLADKILAFWMFLLAFHLFIYYIFFKGMVMEYPVIFGLGKPLPFLHGPMLFLYTFALTGRMKAWKPIQFVHFLPLVLNYVIFSDFLFLSHEGKLELIGQVQAGNVPLSFKMVYPVMVVHALTYITLTMLLLRKHQSHLKESYSYSDHNIDLLWLRGLLAGMTVIWTVVIVANILTPGFRGDQAIYFTVVLFVLFIGFFGIRQGNIFVSQPLSPVPMENAPGKENTEEQKRYQRSGLKEGDASQLSQRLTQLMETEKLYLEDRLTLPAIADRLEIHPNYLSQVINERFKKNFYDFINSYRVEEFKDHIYRGDHRKMTLFSLALESGFTSKGAFNSAFKKFTGQTPTEFIQSEKMVNTL